MKRNDLSEQKKNHYLHHILFVNMALQLVIEGESNSSLPSNSTLPLNSSLPSNSSLPQDNVSETTIEPTFLLRGVQVSKVVSDYLAGKYDEIEIPKTKVNSSVRGVIADYSIGTDARSEIYEFTDRSGRRQRIITVNHDNYDKVKPKLNNHSYLDTLASDPDKIGDLPPGGICLWCRRNFKFNPVGMPVKIEYIEELGKTIYHTIGTYCCYECCYSDLKYKTRCPFTYRDHRYMDSESMLRRMFELTHPGELLLEQNDWMLGQWNGGPLSEEDFFSKSHVYRKDLNMVLLPAKYEYSLQSVSRTTNVHG